MGSKFDFHIHSTASDGSDDIETILKKINKAKISAFSITDHDTIDGALKMEELMSDDNDDIKYIKGIEFSCISPFGKCHILGYNYDQNNEDFKKALEYGSYLRFQKLKARLNFLKEEFNIELSDSEYNWLISQKARENRI